MGVRCVRCGLGLLFVCDRVGLVGRMGGRVLGWALDVLEVR
jgi:hypothetical protein